MAIFEEVLKEMQPIISEMDANELVNDDVAWWKRNIQIKTKHGQFVIMIYDVHITLEKINLTSPDLRMVSEDPRTLLDGLVYNTLLPILLKMKKFGISKNMEFNAIFKLDSMGRYVARFKKA